MAIEKIIEEAANLAETLADSPIYFRYRRAAEGIDAMQQAAAAFAAATDDGARLDAALWVGEAYLLLSSGLPDTGSSEHSTGWVTANQIAKLLGGPEVWIARAQAAYGGSRE